MVLCNSNSIGPRYKSRTQLLAYYDNATGVFAQLGIRAVTGHSGLGKMGSSEIFDILKPFTSEVAELAGGVAYHVTPADNFFSIMNRGLLAKDLPSFVRARGGGRATRS